MICSLRFITARATKDISAILEAGQEMEKQPATKSHHLFDNVEDYFSLDFIIGETSNFVTFILFISTKSG